jgi:hypothetical protein
MMVVISSSFESRSFLRPFFRRLSVPALSTTRSVSFVVATRLSWSASGRLIEKATSCRKPSDEHQQQSAPAKKKKISRQSCSRRGGGNKKISLSFYQVSGHGADRCVSHCVDDDDQVCGQITARPVPHFEKRAKDAPSCSFRFRPIRPLQRDGLQL